MRRTAGRFAPPAANQPTRRVAIALWAAGIALACHCAAAPGGTPLVDLYSGALGQPPGRFAGPSLLVNPLIGSEIFYFRSDADSLTWSGRLARLSMPISAGGTPHPGAVMWEAGALLDTLPSLPSEQGSAAAIPRHIYTQKPDSKKGPATVVFDWEQLAQAQRDALDQPANGGAADGLGRLRAAFLRGDRSLETGQPGGTFRRRASRLGDSIHASPVWVGAPPDGVAGDGYAAHQTRFRDRRSMLYIGANDGMLHAFDAGSGDELFAYVPNALFATLAALTDPAYVHRDYVDGPAGAGEALLAGTWKTVLVSAMGGGAQGVFALDVSDPDNFATRGALWEFTDADDPAMGSLLSAPQVAKMRVRTVKGVPEYRYFAVFASGYNNYADDGEGRFIQRAEGALFLLALDKTPRAAWRRNTNYYKLATPLSDADQPNALGPPALVIGSDGAVRYAYAGDLQGNVWRVDFSGNAPWSAAVGPGPGSRPLFVARDADGLRQPITTQPRVAYAPGGGYLLLLGTGQYVAAADNMPANFRPQSFYAIHDDLAQPPVPVAGRAALAPRTLRAGAGGNMGLALTGAPFVYRGTDAKRGWYVDFPAAQTTGERSVSNAVLAAGKLFFNTLLPGAGPALSPGARSYAVDALTGLAFDDDGQVQSGLLTGQLQADAAPGPPLVLQLSAVAGERSPTGAITVKQHYAILTPSGAAIPAGGAAPPAGAVRSVTLPMPAGRRSWREVANWRELHDAAK